MNIIAREFTWCIGSCEVHIFAVSRFIVRILPNNENLKNKWRTNEEQILIFTLCRTYHCTYHQLFVENSNFTFVSLKLWRKIFHPSWCYCRKRVEFRKAGTDPPHPFYRAQAEFRKVGWGSSPHRRRGRCSPAFFFLQISRLLVCPHVILEMSFLNTVYPDLEPDPNPPLHFTSPLTLTPIMGLSCLVFIHRPLTVACLTTCLNRETMQTAQSTALHSLCTKIVPTQSETDGIRLASRLHGIEMKFQIKVCAGRLACHASTPRCYPTLTSHHALLGVNLGCVTTLLFQRSQLDFLSVFLYLGVLDANSQTWSTQRVK